MIWQKDPESFRIHNHTAKILSSLSKKSKISKSEIIRTAIAQYLAQNADQDEQKAA